MKDLNPTIYVIINKSIPMNAGKVCAQVAHAVSGLFSKIEEERGCVQLKCDPIHDWHKINPRTVIILECPNAEYMNRFSKYISDPSINLIHYIYTDEGSDFQQTAMAIEPVDKLDPTNDLIFGQFKLFTYEKDKQIRKKWWEFYK